MIKGLYIHIPFCDQICTYCDFCKMVTSEHTKKEYMKAVVKELEYYSDLLEQIETIYIGGGTPSSLNIDLLDAFLHELESLVNMKKVIEFTIEANPNDVSPKWLTMIKRHNVTRVSMGVQTLDETLLKFLGRTHSLDIVESAIDLLNQSKIQFNLDFLYGIPGQTKESLLNDLSYIQKFKPHHVSYYSLILEDKTILSYLISNNKVKDFSDDLARDFGEIIDESLKVYDYYKYEFSNYCKPGYESKHNLMYWNLEEYLGVGLQAASQYNYTRMVNPKRISEYLQGVQEKVLTMHRVEDFDPKMETILMGLRKTEGISLEKYRLHYKVDLFDAFPKLTKHLDSKLLTIEDGYLRFTNQGMYLSNQVYMDII